MKQPLIAMHKLQKPESTDNLLKNAIWVYDGEDAKLYQKATLATWIKNLKPGTIIRATQVHPCDVLLLKFHEIGCIVQYCPWHSTEIDKGLKPEGIIKSYWGLPPEKFIPFHPRPDLAELRIFVRWRRSIIDVRKAANQRNEAIAAALGGEKNLTGTYKQNYDEIKKTLKEDKKKAGVEGKLTRQVIEIAKNIHDCQVFKVAADIDEGWVAAATVMAYSGGIERFHSLSAFWKFCGQDVFEGRARSRKRGSSHTWNPKVREALYQMADSIIKNRNNMWRDIYDEYRAKQLAVHDQKCPDCETKDGHCTRMAMRYIVKGILKSYWNMMKIGRQEEAPKVKVMAA